MWRILVVSLIVVVIAITACDDLSEITGKPDAQDEAGLPNPASEHCVDQGGELEIRDEEGGQVGYCLFPDGSECEEWAFMRGECTPGSQEDAAMPNPASQHCVDQGGELEIRDEADGQVGYCLFPDGSECEEWAFFNSRCAPGGAYQPLDPAVCSDIAEAVQDSFTLAVTTEQVAFDDYVTGKSGTGCQATAVGTGMDFASLAEASAILDVVLEARGWEEAMQYQADGPTGTATAYRLHDGLCLSHISWQPAEGTDCPADQPISACELAPEQQLYSATLNCARRLSGSESQTGLPNPASVHCTDQGGELEIRDEADGQVGYCLFPDGSECEEWAFMRGECTPANN